MKWLNHPSSFVMLLLLGLIALSCKREQRSFHVLPSAADAPQDVPYQNPIRPGPSETQPSGTAQDIYQLVHEPYGSQYPDNAQALSDGQHLYEAYNCVGCHAHGGGGMGPPFRDRKWFYGGEPQHIYASILQGRPNGMPSFRGRIPDYQIWEIVGYVRSLSGQASPNAASGREDHLNTGNPPNSTPQEQPQIVPEPTTGPATTTTNP